MVVFTVQCSVCGKDIIRSRLDVERYNNFFCSRKCRGIYLKKHPAKKRKGIIKRCIICGKEYYVPQGKKNSIYCSRKCCGKGNIGFIPWNKGLTKNEDKRLMSVSKKSKTQMDREYKNGIRDKFKITKKANEAMRKIGLDRFNKSPNRTIGKRGYWMIYIPGKKWIKEHHYIWLKAGNKIPKGYNLHHINRNRLDNRLENLRLMTASEHSRLHCNERHRQKSGRLS